MWLLFCAVQLAPAPCQHPRLDVLTPRSGTHVTPLQPWLVVAEVTGLTDGQALLVLTIQGREGSRTAVPLVEGDGHRRMWMPAVPSGEQEMVLLVSVELLEHTLQSAQLHLQVRPPNLIIFYPFDNEPVLVSPGVPLTINFGLTACLSGTPDCFADFQGGQFEHAHVLLDGEPMATTEVSRLVVPFERLPEGFWQHGVEAFASDGDLLVGKEATITVILISRFDREEVLFKSQSITLVALGEGMAAFGDGTVRSAGMRNKDLLPSFKRHIYMDPPMVTFGDTFLEQHEKHGGESPFFTSWHARTVRHGVQPHFVDPWVPSPADEQAADETVLEGAGEEGGRGSGGRRGGGGGDDSASGIYAFVFVHKDPLDFIFQVASSVASCKSVYEFVCEFVCVCLCACFQVALFRRFVQEPVHFSAVVNLDELDPEYHRILARWRVVAKSLNVRFSGLKSRPLLFACTLCVYLVKQRGARD